MPKRADWVTYEKDEIEALITKLAKDGNSNAMIGQIMRDQYGIPDVRKAGIRIAKVSQMVAPKEIPEDLFNLLKQAVKVRRHLDAKKKDAKSRHAMESMESKIRRLAKFYVRDNKLSKDWKYSIEKAKMLVG